MPDLEHEVWFPRTKLYPPQLSDDLLKRSELVERVYNAAIRVPLTILSAPAGFGKTTTAAAVISAHPEVAQTWLKLDEEDNDPKYFLNLLLTALEQVNSQCTHQTRVVLQNIPNPDIELKRVMGVLINDLLNCEFGPILIIFDDLQQITEPGIIQALDYLVENAPPELHLIATTRHEPQLSLARLRARGELAEFYLDDLRFTETEIDILLNQRLHL